MTTEHHHPRKTLPRDEFGRGESCQWIVVAAVPVIVLLLAIALKTIGDPTNRLVVYCAQDMTYAEPILAAFEQASGVKIAAVYDSEAVKTVGLANRLLAERKNPQCDAFWGNEELRTRQLDAAGIFLETNAWAAFGYRSRRIVVNTNKLSLQDAPRSLLDLTNSIWRDKVALAYPQFGTTATHFHALRQYWGPELWEAWCKALANNKPLIMEGNSSVVKVVAAGAACIGLTDSDDIAVGQRDGFTIAAQPMNSETLVIPNTVALIRKPKPNEAAAALARYLQQPGTIEILIKRNALESAQKSPTGLNTLQPDWHALLRDLDATGKQLSDIFLR